MAASRRIDSHEIRLTQGIWRGKKFRFAHPKVRPTTQRTREALINILRSHGALDKDSRVAVVFAGSGAVGFEIMSAFACKVDFVDIDPACARATRDVLASLAGDFEAQSVVHAAEVHVAHVREWNPPQLDAIVADPPYFNGWTNELGWLDRLVEKSGARLVLLETESDPVVEQNLASTGKTFRKYKHGNSTLWLWHC